MPSLPPVQNPRFRWRRGALQPPGLWVDDGDVLVLTVNALSGVVAAVEARLRLLSPRLVIEDLRLRVNVVAGVPTPFVAVGPLFQGFLQGGVVSALAPDAVPPGTDSYTPGELYAHLVVGRGRDTALYQHTLLCAGYVTTRTVIGFPGGRSTATREGPGRLRRVTVAPPGLGQEWALSSSAAFWKIRSGSWVLTTSAIAGNREPQLREQDNGNISYQTGSNVVQPANTVNRYAVGAHGAFGAISGNTRLMTWPADWFLTPARFVRSFTAGLDAGDDYSQISFELEEWAF
jgi:hypothetical protein